MREGYPRRIATEENAARRRLNGADSWRSTLNTSPRGPCTGLDRERAGTEDLVAALAELGLAYALQRGEVHAGRPDSKCDRQCGFVNVMQADCQEQLSEMAFVSAGQTGFTGFIGVEFVHGIPERRQGRLPARVVPYARCDHPTLTCDPRHLGQAAYRIVHEVNDELRQGSVELTIGKRQRFGGCDAYVNSGMALLGGGGELLGRIDSRYGCRSETSDELGRQRARATADIERTVARYDLGEVGKRRRQPNGVPAHEAVVGVGGDGEAHGVNL
jgi:hypothetical protein